MSVHPNGGARVRLTIDGPLATLTLIRPEKRNALDDAAIEELRAAFRTADADDRVRVVLLNAEGPDFCAGADLSQLERIAAGASREENYADAMRLGSLLVQMRALGKPIVAAVHGKALAGGAGLATACDLVVAHRDAVFGYPEVHLGFVPAMVMALLRRTVGEKVAFELAALGDRISAQRAMELGLVNRVLPGDDFVAASRTFAEELATRSASAVSLVKRLLHDIDTLPFDASIERGAEINVEARMTEDCQAGVRRFLDRGRR